jgi:hypothetical protein
MRKSVPCFTVLLAAAAIDCAANDARRRRRTAFIPGGNSNEIAAHNPSYGSTT